jgi:hypothetical protein
MNHAEVTHLGSRIKKMIFKKAEMQYEQISSVQGYV